MTMKVKTRMLPVGIQGTMDDMIYYVEKRSGRTLMRKSFSFEDHPGQPAFRDAQRQIYLLNPSAAYKQDLKDYCLSYNGLPKIEGKTISSWCQMYNKLMWAMQKAMPESVSLKTITREQIYTQNLPCISIKAAVEAGLLPAVKNYEFFNSQL